MLIFQPLNRFWYTNMVAVRARLLPPPRSIDTSEHVVPGDSTIPHFSVKSASEFEKKHARRSAVWLADVAELKIVNN